MKQLKKLKSDRLYKVSLRIIDKCSEYCLCDANDSDGVYCILNNEEVEE